MQDERFVVAHLDLAGQVGLVGGGVDVRVLVVVEDPEELVEPHVDAGRLDHLAVEGVERDTPGVDLGEDVAVGEEHESKLTHTASVVWSRSPPAAAPM